jgi:orotidine-5'-phosphate decarboxylase
LGEVMEHARHRGLLVIADGKRGDVPVTAEAYGHALFAPAPPGAPRVGQDRPAPRGARALQVDGLGADLATVNPLLGRDALQPLVAAARASRAGVLVLVRTSNPGAADVLDLELATTDRGSTDRGSRSTNRGSTNRGSRSTDRRSAGTVWERLATLVEELGVPGVGRAGLSDVGAVMGATEPRHLARARELMPHATLLLPGVGAQGGRVEELAAAFAPGRAGGLIAASRSIANAHLASGGDPAGAARAAAERLRTAAWSLG